MLFCINTVVQRGCALLILVLLLVACGGGGGSNGGGGGSGPYEMGGSIQGETLNLSVDVTTLAGTVGMPGSADDTGSAALFNFPEGITTDGSNLYVADTTNQTIRQIDIATGVVTTLAGTAGEAGSADGTGSAARFNYPGRITIDGADLYVAESSTIRKIEIATGVVTTLAGTPGSSGSTDGTGSEALFSGINGITNDGTNLYVSDTNNFTIRQIVISTGVVTTLAGTPGLSGSSDGTGSAALFSGPNGITTDGTNLYVTDPANGVIRQIEIATGVVTTLAGSAGLHGSTDGIGSAARFSAPQGITTDGERLYVTDQIIRQIEISTGEVTTLAGTAALFSSPMGITTDGSSLFVVDSWNHAIREID